MTFKINLINNTRQQIFLLNDNVDQKLKLLKIHHLGFYGLKSQCVTKGCLVNILCLFNRK